MRGALGEFVRLPGGRVPECYSTVRQKFFLSRDEQIDEFYFLAEKKGVKR